MASVDLLLSAPPDAFAQHNGLLAPLAPSESYGLHIVRSVSAASEQALARLVLPGETEFACPVDVRYDDSDELNTNDPEQALKIALKSNNWSAVRLVATAPDSRVDRLGKALQASGLNQDTASMPALTNLSADLLTEPEQLLAETDRAVARILTAADTATAAEAAITARVMIDAVRLASKKMQVPLTATVEAIIVADENSSLVASESLWDTVARIDVPPSLSADVLKIMEKSNTLNHPLAFNLLAMLPENHAFIATQHQRVSALKELVAGPVEAVMESSNLKKVLELSAGIISVYPVLSGDHMMGLDIELWPKIEACTVPPGCVMGQDTHSKTMPELRLIPDHETLAYNNAWRKRFFQIWLWKQTTAAVGKSIHIHADKSKGANVLAFHQLFGESLDDVEDNDLGTIEVRTSLEGYSEDFESEVEDGIVRGFSNLHLARLVDLLYALRQAPLPNKGTKIAGQTPVMQRMRNILATTTDPAVRAAGLHALTQEDGQRIIKMKDLDDFFKDINGDHFTGVRYVACINVLPASYQCALIDHLLANKNKYALEKLSLLAGGLDVEAQHALAEECIKLGYSTAISSLCTQIESLDAATARLLADNAVNSGTTDALVSLSHGFGVLEPTVQEKLVKTMLAKPEFPWRLDKMTCHITNLPADLKMEVVHHALTRSRNDSALHFYYQLADLPEHSIRQLWRYTQINPSVELIGALIENMPQLPQPIRDQAGQWLADNSQDTRVLYGRYSAIHCLDAAAQRQLIYNTFDSGNTYQIMLLAPQLASMSAELQNLLLEHIFNDDDPGVVYTFMSSVQNIPETLQSRLVDLALRNGWTYPLHAYLTKFSDRLKEVVQEHFLDGRTHVIPAADNTPVSPVINSPRYFYPDQITSDMPPAQRLAVSSNMPGWDW